MSEQVKSIKTSMLFELVLSDLSPVNLVFQHPSDSRLHQKHPGQDEQIYKVRYKTPYIIYQRHFLQIVLNLNCELSLIGDRRSTTTVSYL